MSFFEFGSKTYVMGVLNVTPDSFSDGGEFIDPGKAVQHAKAMEDEGADIIDIGGESTRPGSVEIDADEEIRRIYNPLKYILQEVSCPVSVDTYKGETAKQVLEMGAHMINDVWGLQKDKNMAEVVAYFDVPVVIMHNQEEARYEGDIMEEIKDYLKRSIEIAKKSGIKEKHIIVDPGIGFGKNALQSAEVMKRLDELKELGFPILLGASRKRMIGHILDLPTNERLEGTIATTVAGILKGVDIVRVHDVKENLRAAKLADFIYRE